MTSIERSLFDAGRLLAHQQVGAALDHAVRDGLTTYERYQQRVKLGRRGRAGLGDSETCADGPGIRRRLRVREGDEGVAGARSGSRTGPRVQATVHGFRYRVDFAYPDSTSASNADSGEWHGLFHQVECDLERQNRIQKEGLLLMRYTVRRLRDECDAVGAEIVEAIARRGRLHTRAPAWFLT